MAVMGLEMRFNAKVRCNLFVRNKCIPSDRKKKQSATTLANFFVNAFFNASTFNFEHHPLSFGGFLFGLYEKESTIAMWENELWLFRQRIVSPTLSSPTYSLDAHA